MRRLVTLAVLIISGVSQVSAAEPPDDAKAPTSPETKAAASNMTGPDSPKAVQSAPRQPPPAPPREYLAAGARLFNKGRYELASKYFEAARMYRDGLTESERIVLEVYEEKLDEYRRESQNPKTQVIVPTDRTAEPKKAVGLDPSVTTAGTEANPTRDVVRDSSSAPVWKVEPPITATTPEPPKTPIEPQSSPGHPPRLGMESGPVYGSATWRDSGTEKEKARWLLKLAREQIFKEHFDVAAKAIAEARDMGVKWTIFDETPDKMTETLEKAKAKKAKELAAGPGGLRDRWAAKARLRDARAALARGDLEEAKTIAREVGSWGVGYGLFDDTPAKVASAIADARRRLTIRNAELTVKSYASERTAPDPKVGPAPTNPPPAMPSDPD